MWGISGGGGAKDIVFKCRGDSVPVSADGVLMLGLQQYEYLMSNRNAIDIARVDFEAFLDGLMYGESYLVHDQVLRFQRVSDYLRRRCPSAHPQAYSKPAIPAQSSSAPAASRPSSSPAHPYSQGHSGGWKEAPRATVPKTSLLVCPVGDGSVDAMERVLADRLLRELGDRGLVRAENTTPGDEDICILYDRGIPPSADESADWLAGRLRSFKVSYALRAATVLYVAFFSGQSQWSDNFLRGFRDLGVTPFVMVYQQGILDANVYGS